jgi:hypothetical protein
MSRATINFFVWPRWLTLAASILLSVGAGQAKAVIRFDDSTDSILVSGQTVLASSCTYEARVLVTSSSFGGGDVFNEWTDSAEDKYFAVMPSTIGAYSYPVNRTAPMLPTVALTPNVWHHIAYVYAGSQERMYVDGNQIGSRSASGAINNGAGQATVGAIYRDYQVIPSMIGYMDTLRISDNARYSGLNFVPPTGDLPSDSHTQLLYNFNEPPGSLTVTDNSPNHRTGTLATGFSGATAPVFVPDPVPEPSTIALLAAGALGLVAWRFRRGPGRASGKRPGRPSCAPSAPR